MYPAHVTHNVRKLAPVFDDIELVLFESTDYSNMPNPLEIEELASIAQKHETTFTIHFPIDRKAGSVDAMERMKFADQAISIIELTEPLKPFGFILHLEGIRFDSSAQDVAIWKSNVDTVCSRVVQYADPFRFCIETLGYDSMLNIPVAYRHGFSHCIDIGHLWIYKQPWQQICAELLPSTRVIHLHGLHEGKDHKSLIYHDSDQLKCFVDTVLRKFTGVVTIELFSEQETFGSLELLEELWK